MKLDGSEYTIAEENECDASSFLAPISRLEIFRLLTLLFSPGCTTDMSEKSIVDFVLLFLTTALLESIVTETNRYADD